MVHTKPRACQTTILDLPAELIASVIASLPAETLSRLCLTHSYFNNILRDDLLWRRSVLPHRIANSSFEYCHVRCELWEASRSNSPASSSLRVVIDAGMTPLYRAPKPYLSYRQLYVNVLREHGWMLGTWAGNCQWLGSIVEVFYNHRVGRIQCRRLQPFAVFSKPETFSIDPEVRWRDFSPVVQAWDETVFSLGPPMDHELQTTKVSRIVADCVGPLEADRTSDGGGKVWPTKNIPARDRIFSSERSAVQSNGLHKDSEYSDDLMAISRPIFTAAASMMEDDATVTYDDLPRHTELFYRLPRDLPAPPAFAQYSGLFMGDYSAHGPEILYLHYPTPTSLHAVKVTGDPNVPRGELSWVVDDLTTPTRLCTEREWPGARAYAGRGQICYHHGFTNPAWIETEVILYERSPSASAPTTMGGRKDERRSIDRSHESYEEEEDDDDDEEDEDDDLSTGTQETTQLGIALWWKDMSHISQFHKIRGISRPAPQDFAMFY